MLPASSERVATHTSKAVERRLHNEFEDRLAYFAGHRGEIERERYALKALRGDFDGVRQAENPIVAALRGVGGSLMRGRNGS